MCHQKKIVYENIRHTDGSKWKCRVIPDKDKPGIDLLIAPIELEDLIETDDETDQMISYYATADEMELSDGELFELMYPKSSMTILSLPNAQKALIKKALAFYLSQYKTFNQVPTETEGYEMFDLMTLQALFNYNVEIKLTHHEAGSFTSANGIDLPIYIHD